MGGRPGATRHSHLSPRLGGATAVLPGRSWAKSKRASAAYAQPRASEPSSPLLLPRSPSRAPDPPSTSAKGPCYIPNLALTHARHADPPPPFCTTSHRRPRPARRAHLPRPPARPAHLLPAYTAAHHALKLDIAAQSPSQPTQPAPCPWPRLDRPTRPCIPAELAQGAPGQRCKLSTRRRLRLEPSWSGGGSSTTVDASVRSPGSSAGGWGPCAGL